MSCKIIGRAITTEELKKLSKRRERKLSVRRKWYAQKRDVLNERRRERYAADPEYREREKIRKRESAARHAVTTNVRTNEYRRLHPENERAKAARRKDKLREYEQRRRERKVSDAEFLKRERKRKRENMRKHRLEISLAKTDPKTQADFVRLWESVANGGPKKVAAYMKIVQEPVKSRFVRWYGKKMNWIDSTGGRKFQPPPGADIAVESDDFFFS